MTSLITSLSLLSKNNKKILLLFLDFILFPILLWVCYVLKSWSIHVAMNLPFSLGVSLLTVGSLVVFGIYSFILRSFTETLILRLALATLTTVLNLYVLSFISEDMLPRTIPLIYGFLMFSWIWFSRGIIRFIIKTHLSAHADKKRIVVYGAGSSGQQIISALYRSFEYAPIFFIDDNKQLWGRTLDGFKVYAFHQAIPLLKQCAIDEILIAMPSVDAQRRREIIQQLSKTDCKIKELPNIRKLVNGEVKLSDMQEISIEDLLGRDPVPPIMSLLNKNLKNQNVMVTGAGGSIGSELCRQIILNKPTKLVLFEICEYALYSIHRDLLQIQQEQGTQVEIIPLLGSVQNFKLLVNVMETFEINTVYHAAAYKHVPLVEYNIIPGVYNNIFGTYYAAKAAIQTQVNSFVLISTDKAVRPTNIMGTTKRLAELCLQAFADMQGKFMDGVLHQTQFCMVRFGNVLGSSGSVIPLFKQQIKDGGPITVTDERIIRYFMTIPEAAQLVIQAGAMAKGGDVFILDMGEPVKIVELAKKLISLSGLTLKDSLHPDGDIEIQFTGLRPGEKLYEELLIAGDSMEHTQHSRILTAQESFLPFNDLILLLEKLEQACKQSDYKQIREILLNAPTGYQPVSELADLIYTQKNHHIHLMEAK
ncbi:polysaccharide biosynthesis protein [Pasteurella sp. PK-2025]|uniref:polysaccharide biosynthesis protein n=1 Tax=unclassified Pasteurella TaxID=2621516 RepID=UPI003C7756EA